MTTPRPVTAISADVRSGVATACDVTRAALARLDAITATGAVRTRLERRALDLAVHVDAAVASGSDPGPLAGVPFLIKDNICGEALTEPDSGPTAGSRMLRGYRTPFVSTAVARLVAAGAIPIGYAQCDEFAMGSSGEHCAHATLANPWHHELVPGGSSGGSACAVGAGAVPFALGSDTGGSIRQPAAFCGAVGVKPTYGRVSRWGLIAFGSSLDQIGPFTRCVDDAARVLAPMCGVDPHDATSADVAADFLPPPSDAPDDAPPRIGVLRRQLDAPTDPRIAAEITMLLERAAAAGATIVDVECAVDDLALAVYYVIATAEASSNLARYDGIRYGNADAHAADAPTSLDDLYVERRTAGFGAEVRRRILLGTYVLSAGYADRYYHRALRARRVIADRLHAALDGVDVLLGPTSPVLPFARGTHLDPVTMYQCDVFTVPANLAGIPALSLPCGPVESDAHGAVPVGVQLQARAFDERRLFHAARFLERCAAFAPLTLGADR